MSEITKETEEIKEVVELTPEGEAELSNGYDPNEDKIEKEAEAK